MVELQHIVVDAGSADRTKEIVLSYGISEFYELKNSSMYEAIDYGFRKSRGDILCWLNSDDIFYDRSLLFVLNYFNENNAIDVITGNHVFINSESKELYEYKYYFCTSKLAELFPVLMLSQPSTFWRRHVYFEIGGLNLDYTVVSDRDFFIRMFRKYDTKHIDKKLSKFRVHGQNKSLIMNDVAVRENKTINNCLGAGPTNLLRKIISMLGMSLIKILNNRMWIWKFQNKFNR